MQVKFRGCYNITVLSTIPPNALAGSPKRFLIAGAQPASNGAFSGEVAGLTTHVEGIGQTIWTLTVENIDFNVGPNNWNQSPIVVTQTAAGTEIAANDDEQSQGPFDDLVLLCSPCNQLPLHIPREAVWNSVTWGVKVDGGGFSGNGPVPPWTPFVREFAAGLALAETALLVRSDLRGTVLQAAAKQVNGAAAEIERAISGA